MKSNGESPAHSELKRLAIHWALENGFPAVATEVRLPRSAFRADVVAYRPGKNALGLTAVFECKQSRADFLKDSYATQSTRERLLKLEERRATLERLLRVHHPSLRQGESLFEEFDAVDFDQLDHRTYHRVLREIGILQRRLYGKTKFDRLTRYRCANLNYLVVAPGILRPEEVPVGWGVLGRRDGALQLDRAPTRQEIADRDKLWQLHRLAIANTRQALALPLHFPESVTRVTGLEK